MPTNEKQTKDPAEIIAEKKAKIVAAKAEYEKTKVALEKMEESIKATTFPNPEAETKALESMKSLKEKAESQLQSIQKLRVELASQDSYIPDNPKEINLFHVKLEREAFDSKTGQRLSKPFIQKFTIPDWNQFEKNSTGLGYSVNILWNPTIYNS